MRSNLVWSALCAIFTLLASYARAQETWQDDDTRITYEPKGSWKHWTGAPTVSSGTISFTSQAQANYSFSFEGTTFELWGSTKQDRGWADVAVDGQSAGSFDQFEASKANVSAPIQQISINNLAAGTHEVVVSNRGGDDARIPSRGQPDLAVDYIVIRNEPPASASSTAAQSISNATNSTTSEDVPIIKLESDDLAPNSRTSSRSASSPSITTSSSSVTSNETAESVVEAQTEESKNQTVLVAAICSSLAALVILFGILTGYILYRRKQISSSARAVSYVPNFSSAASPVKEDFYSPRAYSPGQYQHLAPVEAFAPEAPFSSYGDARRSYGGTTGWTRALSESDKSSLDRQFR